MNLLLDTHTVVWWWTDDPRIPAAARQAIAEAGNIVYVSAVSAWEIATKNRLGKWPGVERIVEEFPALLRKSRFVPLPVSVEHARQAGMLTAAHRDPFDRMLIAQSREEKAMLVSADTAFRALGVDLIWA
ncbi:MAG: type II toxin-antitoxin system VapC family toxin [Acetobacteraceae bacterium]|nr:type II toxin-antitoxin system VapC family toxin [Acetobacteraceae bacterium]